jgi:hypothetical protein
MLVRPELCNRKIAAASFVSLDDSRHAVVFDYSLTLSSSMGWHIAD